HLCSYLCSCCFHDLTTTEIYPLSLHDALPIYEYQFDFHVLYSCGPIPMLKALEDRFKERKGYISLEQRMGCGIGACFACVCHLRSEEHTSELQSREDLVCRLRLEKKKERRRRK